IDGLDISVNIDGTSIVADVETGVLSVAPEALVQYVGSNTIIVDDAPLLDEGGNPMLDENGEPIYTNNKEISVKIASNEHILNINDGLKATLTLELVDVPASEGVVEHKEIQLKGINGVVIGSIDATDFLVDGMLDNVSFDIEPILDEEGNPILYEDGQPMMVETNNLIFTFNTVSGKKPITVDLSKYIDIYEAGNGINVINKTISVKVKDEEKYLEVTTDGIATKGIEEAIEAAKTTVNDDVVDGEFVTGISKDEETGEITATHAKVSANQVTLENVNDGVENSNIQLEATDVQAGIQELFNKMLDNEEVTAQAINKLIDVLGTSAKDSTTDQVVYVAPTGSTILADATSFTHADILLSEAIKALQDNDVIDCGTY
ncbi:MAG: hypothetical protein K2H20_00440, partial [Bacilli bacterium]|nr:hypothetical protein [Bacilli bacterium]